MDYNIVLMLCNYISLSNTLQIAYITLLPYTIYVIYIKNIHRHHMTLANEKRFDYNGINPGKHQCWGNNVESVLCQAKLLVN